jgi:hypothetical protein
VLLGFKRSASGHILDLQKNISSILTNSIQALTRRSLSTAANRDKVLVWGAFLGLKTRRAR